MITNKSKHQQISVERLQYIQGIIENQKGCGKQVPMPVRKNMERLFGRDFSDVCIHEGPEAAMIGAKAFACGNDIYFAEGMYYPWSVTGLMLLAHELTHIVQRREGRVQITNRNKLSIVYNQKLEKEANYMANQVLTGRFYNNHNSTRNLYVKNNAIGSQVIQCSFTEYVHAKDVINELKKHKMNSKSPLVHKVVYSMFHDERKYSLQNVIDRINTTKRVLIGGVRKFRKKHSLSLSINMDRIKGTTFSHLRQDKLKDLEVSLYLKKIYGLRTAKNQSVDNSSSLKLSNIHSDKYLRDSPTNAISLFQKLDDDKKKKDTKYQSFCEFPGDFKYYYVNSKLIKRKIELLKNLEPTDIDMQFMRLSGCIYRIRVENRTYEKLKFSNKDRVEQTFYKLMHYFGATPSSYQALKELNFTEPQLDSDNKNNEELTNLLKSKDFKTVKNNSKDDNYALRYVYQVVFSLVNGLSKFISKKKFIESIAIKTALQSIKNLIGILAISKDNTTNSTRICALLMDEIFMIIAVIRPYDNVGFKDIVTNIYKKRIKTLENLMRKHKISLNICMESSGMGAISTAFAAAFANNASNCKVSFINEEVDYYEAPTLSNFFLSNKTETSGFNIGKFFAFIWASIFQSEDSKYKIFYATLNPSTPKIASNINEIIKKVKVTKALSITLIIDSTIEIDKGDKGQLKLIINGLSDLLKKGKLNIILAKSYQKYAALGSAKMMSGLVMAINNGNKKFQKSNAFIKKVADKSNFIQLDENQVMTYFLDTASELEIKLIENASKNAKFVSGFWKSEREHCSYLKELPFLSRCVPFSFKKEYTKGVDVCSKIGLEYRDSFSFLNTSYLPLQQISIYRFNLGQEPKNRLVEKLYAFSYVVEKFKIVEKGPFLPYLDIDVKNFFEEIKKIKDGNGGNDSYKYNKFASFLNMAFILFEKEKTYDLQKHYENFFNANDNPLNIVTPEMRETLFINWLKLNITKTKSENRVERIKVNKINTNFIKNNIEKIKNLCPFIPACKRTLFFMNDLPEDIFIYHAGKDNTFKQKLSKSLLLGLDFETILFVCRELIKKGKYYKLKYILYLISDNLAIYKLTQDSLTKMQRIEDKQSPELNFPIGLTIRLIAIQDYPYRTKSEFWGAVRVAAGEIKINEKQKEEILKLAKSSLKENVISGEGLLAEDITQPLLTKSWKEMIEDIQLKALKENERIVNEYNQHCRKMLSDKEFDKKGDVKKRLLANLKKNMVETHNINCFINNFCADDDLSGYLTDGFKKVKPVVNISK
jgi:hypothetical protein